MPRCAAKTASTGKKCSKNALEGEIYCKIHLKKHNSEEEVQKAAEVELPDDEEEEEPEHVPEPVPEPVPKEPVVNHKATKEPVVPKERVPNATKEPKDPQEPAQRPQKIHVKRNKRPKRPITPTEDVDDGAEGDEGAYAKAEESIHDLRAQVNFLTKMNTELIRLIKDLNALRAFSGLDKKKKVTRQSLTPEALDKTARWLFYKMKKDDTDIMKNIRAHMKQVNFDPTLREAKIPYQYVKLGTDHIFNNTLSEMERAEWMDKAALKLITKGVATKGF